MAKPYRSLRLSYINLDNPAFTSDERDEECPWGDEATGLEVEDMRGLPLRGGPSTEAPHSTTGIGKSIASSTNSVKGHIN